MGLEDIPSRHDSQQYQRFFHITTPLKVTNRLCKAIVNDEPEKSIWLQELMEKYLLDL